VADLQVKDRRSDTEQELSERCIAVTSGKGGVGKTTTAVNLALYYASKGLRVALADLDPLADVAAFLDLRAAEAVLGENETLREDAPLSRYTLRAYERLDVLFPGAKLGEGESSMVRHLLFEVYAEELSARYDILLFDLPAGSGEEENLSYLWHISHIVLVTAPEPTAHVSAGGYSREILSRFPERDILVWHNRFRHTGIDGFNPRAVVQNYNRNSPEEARISDEDARRFRDLAAVPDDPALNLLGATGPDSVSLALSSMRTLCRRIAEETARKNAERAGLAGALRELAVDVLLRHPEIFEEQEDREQGGKKGGGRQQGDREHGDSAETHVEPMVSRIEEQVLLRLGSEVSASVEGLAAYLRSSGSMHLLSDEKRGMLAELVRRLSGDAVWQRAVAAREAVGQVLDDRRERQGAFGPSGTPQRRAQLYDRAELRVRRLLSQCAAARRRLPSVYYDAAVLLFGAAVFKLVRVEKVRQRITAAVPRRAENGRETRDRAAQIAFLVHGNEAYRKRYAALVRALYPVLTKQLSQLAAAWNVRELLVRNKEGKVERRAYLNLLSNYLHDVLFGGLGIITGFKYRTASQAFADAAESLLDRLGLGESRRGRERPT